jgi:hypothetical protein
MTRADALLGRLTRACALVVMLAAAHPVSAAGDCRPIEALPVTIGEPGTHCLAADLRTRIEAGAAITVAADWVTLDLRGFQLVGTDSDSTAIEAFDRRGVTVRDGAIRGFGNGIRLLGQRGGDHLVERIRLEDVSGVGVRLEGSRNVVRENLFHGSPTRGAAGAGTKGVVVRGPLSRALDNTLIAIFDGVGLEITEGEGAIVEGNVVAGAQGAVATTGVRVTSGANVLLLRNDLRDLARDIVCGRGSGFYRGNVTRAVTQPYSGGTDAERTP